MKPFYRLRVFSSWMLDVFKSVETGNSTYGFVPFESSGSGIFEETLEGFSNFLGPSIIAEVYYKVFIIFIIDWLRFCVTL